jgi:hypothetical protein
MTDLTPTPCRTDRNVPDAGKSQPRREVCGSASVPSCPGQKIYPRIEGTNLSVERCRRRVSQPNSLIVKVWPAASDEKP